MQIDSIISDMVGNDVGREVADADMSRREDSGFRSDIPLVILHCTMSDNQTSDVQVEWRMLGSILGSQRVEHKLEVVLALCRLLIQVGFQTEQLCRCDGNLMVEQRQQTDLCRNSGRIDHAVAFLVVHHHIINDDTVEET